MPGIAPPLNAGTSYNDTSSIITDVTDVIYQITPEDTPFFHLCGDGRPSGAPRHEWQVRDLSTRVDNANFEGFNYTFTSTMRLPTRAANYLHILNKDLRVSRTQQEIKHYAIDSMVADQAETRLVELKTDTEHALLRSTLATGASGVARRMAGIIPMIQSNLSMYTNGTAATISELLFNGMLEQGWGLGAQLRDALVDGRMKRCISNFTGNATKFIGADEQRVVSTINVVETDFGPVNVHLSRDLPTFNTGTSLGRTILLVDKTHLQKSWLTTPRITKTADIADSTDMIAVQELTLEWGNPNAHAAMCNFVSSI